MTAVETVAMNGPVTPARPRSKTSQRPVCLSFPTKPSASRIVFLSAGSALISFAALMWVLPAPETELNLAVMKLLASVFFLLTGLALLMRNHDQAKPEVHFDSRRRELRVVERDDRGRPHLLLKRSYDSLGSVYISSNDIELWNEDGSPFVTLPVPDEEVRNKLRVQFGTLCA